jgi:predicted GNAT superfamily acetyltransferase
MSDEISIRRAATIAEYQALQEAQRRAWGITRDGYVVPVATMVGAQLHGGLVLGAFRPDGEAVGLAFAFLGRIEGRLGLYSQLTGVVPGYQGHGIGYQLKLAQWEYARAQDLALVAWAFDPLQAGNAHFNLAKLGATSRRYVQDMYGPRTDALNAGAPTDRLIVEWETAPGHRAPLPPRIADTLPHVISASDRAGGLRGVDAVAARLSAPQVLLEIPPDILHLRQHAPSLADQWQRAVRTAFLEAFAAGYRATGFIRRELHDGRRCYYLLERAAE